jgi:hypothetical protein
MGAQAPVLDERASPYSGYFNISWHFFESVVPEQ